MKSWKCFSAHSNKGVDRLQYNDSQGAIVTYIEPPLLSMLCYIAEYSLTTGAALKGSAVSPSSFLLCIVVITIAVFSNTHQRPLRDGFMHGKGLPQPMSFPPEHHNRELAGGPKGIKRVLKTWVVARTPRFSAGVSNNT